MIQKLTALATNLIRFGITDEDKLFYALVAAADVVDFTPEDAGTTQADIINLVIKTAQELVTSREKVHIVDAKHLRTFSQSLESYEKNIKAYEGRRFQLIGILDKVSGGIRCGELAYVIARAGCFKTCFLQNSLFSQIMKLDGLKEKGIALLFSFEMPEEGMVERTVQMITSKTSSYVHNNALNNTQFWQAMKNAEGIAGPVKDRIITYYGGPLTVDQMGEYVLIAQTMTGQPVTAVGIDYMGYIHGDGQNSYERVSEIARDLKINLARKYSVPVICLCQTNRSAGAGTDEVQLNSARDSGAIEESGDFVYGLWRIEGDLLNEYEEIKGRLLGRVLKERRHLSGHGLGHLGYFEVKMDAECMRIDDIVRAEKPAPAPRYEKGYA